MPAAFKSSIVCSHPPLRRVGGSAREHHHQRRAELAHSLDVVDELITGVRTQRGAGLASTISHFETGTLSAMLKMSKTGPLGRMFLGSCLFVCQPAAGGNWPGSSFRKETSQRPARRAGSEGRSM